METGLLQKRKHLPGWDLSLFQKEPGVRSDRPFDREMCGPLEERPEEEASASHGMDRITTHVSDGEFEMPRAPAMSVIPEAVIPNIDRTGPKVVEVIRQKIPEPDPQQERVKKKWNKFAIPAFLAALATLYLGFFGTSTIAVIIALGVTFILSGISLRQIRSRDEAGKGFALAALMIGVIAAVATAIVTYAIGFI